MRMRYLLPLVPFLLYLTPLATAEQISQLPYETGWMDLETGATFVLEPWELPPDEADFKFAYSGGFGPHAVIFQNECVGPNCEQWVEIAYSSEVSEQVRWGDLPDLTFSRGIVDVPSSDVAILLTPEGNYYKLAFIEEVNCGYEICVSFRWEEIVPDNCELEAHLFNVPEAVVWEETIYFDAQVLNPCPYDKSFDEAVLHITGPPDKHIPLYSGDPIILGPESDLTRPLSLTVPWGAPVMDYQLSLIIFRDGQDVARDDVMVTVTP
jgi:hypothetical protein